MILFTIFNFWTDLKNYWNTGNKFGEGMTNLQLHRGGTYYCSSSSNEKLGTYAANNAADCVTDCSKQYFSPTRTGLKCQLGKYHADTTLPQRTEPPPAPTLATKTTAAAASVQTCIATCQPKCNEFTGCDNEQTCQSKYPNVTMDNWNGSTTSSGYQNCNVGCSNEYKRGCDTSPYTPEVQAASAKISLSIDGRWNSSINKEFDCKPGVYTVDDSPAYSTSSNCEAKDRCEVELNNKCEARIRMRDRCKSARGRYSFSDYITSGKNIEKDGCKIKQIVYKQTPEAAAMTAESPSNETPVVNNIQAPIEPEWHDTKLAKSFKLPNGHLVRPGEGVCPNACKIPHYDNKECANEILDGKEYRNCKWVKDGTSDIDCKNCGAVLIPKNEYGYARTNPSLFDIDNVNTAIRISYSDKNKDNYYNTGKQFMEQLAYIKNFSVPDSITTEEYVSMGKLIYAHQKYPQSTSVEQTLTRFINTILRTNSLTENGTNIKANDLVSEQVRSQGGNFDLDKKKLTGTGAIAYKQGLEEAESDNRLGGSKSLYREMTQDSGYTKQYHPNDPRRKPSPYNSIWNVFSY